MADRSFPQDGPAAPPARPTLPQMLAPDLMSAMSAAMSPSMSPALEPALMPALRPPRAMADAERAIPEADLLAEHWEAVLCYADLCTTTPTEAVRLAADGFSRGLREVREAGAGNSPYLPWLPLLLIAVRHTAAAWQAAENGDRIQPELRIWLNAERAIQRGSGRGRQPVALRGLQDLPEPDRTLLWHAEVESRPVEVTARLLGTDVAGARKELARGREQYRELCLRAHLDTLDNEMCRGYARLLDVATRTPDSVPSQDLRQHLARCLGCGEAAVCLSPYDGGLPGALAGGVIGWGGLLYLERRRTAAARGSTGAVVAAVAAGSRHRRAPATLPAGRPVRRATARRFPWGTARMAGVVAVIGAAVMAGVVTSPNGSTSSEAAGTNPATGGELPTLPATVGEPGTADPSGEAGLQTVGSGIGIEGAGEEIPAEVPTGVTSAAAVADTPVDTPAEPSPAAPGTTDPASGSDPGSAVCTARYTLVNEWPDGFQAEVVITPREALNGWQLSWTFPDGQRVTQMWNGSYAQNGSGVTVAPVGYNMSVGAGQPLLVGFLGTWAGGNSAPTDFALDGSPCQ